MTSKWKENVRNILDLIGVDQVQRHCLAAFSQKGDAGKWYKLQFSQEERLTLAWDEFVWRFDLQFISSSARAGKERELLTLEQGEMSVTAYESKFVGLLHFADGLFQTDDRQAQMFLGGLRPQIRRYLASLRFHSLREVADAAASQELEIIAGQKGKEVVAKAAEKGKGKRPFAAVQQQQGGAHAAGQAGQRDPNASHNCGKLGHYARDCRSPR